MTLKDSRNDHGTTKSDPNSLERKRRVSNRARMQKRGARRRPFEIQTQRLGRNGGPPKAYPNLREGEPRNLEEWRRRHTHTVLSFDFLEYSLNKSIQTSLLLYRYYRGTIEFPPNRQKTPFLVVRVYFFDFSKKIIKNDP